jgi:hypothetical protein
MRKFIVAILLFATTLTGCIGFVGDGRGGRGYGGGGYYHHHDWR